MTKHEYNMDQGPTTILVVNEEELSGICDFVVEQSMLNKTQADKIKQEGVLPLAAKGTNTAPLFEKYNVETPYMGVVLRGYAEKLGLTIVDSDTSDQLMDEAQGSLSDMEKEIIKQYVDELLPTVNDGRDYRPCVKRFAQRMNAGNLASIGMIQNLVDQSCAAIKMTAQQRSQVPTHTWDDVFRNYLRKLLVGICLLLNRPENGAKND